MALYRIADLLCEFEPKYDRLKSYAEKYRIDESTVNIEQQKNTLFVSDSFLESKVKENPAIDIGIAEYMYMGAELCRLLLHNDGFVLHASSVAYENKAYLFSAPCETGKSTHTSLWQKHFGADKTCIINDDKPAIRKINGVYTVSGTPFSGKSPLSTNTTVQLQGICFISQSKTNHIEKITPDKALPLIMDQTYRPMGFTDMNLLLDVLSDLLLTINVFEAGLDMSSEAVMTTYNAMSKAQ